MQQLFFMQRVVEPFGNDVRKKEKKNMRETILKRTKTCHESRIWENWLNGEGGCNENTDHILENPPTSVVLQRNVTEFETKS